MIDMKKVINLIEDIIKRKETQRRQMGKYRLPSTNLESTINKIKKSASDIENLVNLEEIEIESLRTISDVHIIHNLIGYIDFMQVKKDGAGFEILDTSQQKIKNICSKIINDFNNYKENILLNDKKYKNISEDIKKLKKLKIKLNNSFDIESSDIDYFIKVLYEAGEKEDTILEYIIFINCGFMETIEQVNFEDIQETAIELSLESVVSLFEEYGYDFNQLPDKEKNKILLKGNLNTIREILEVLKENKIDLNEKMNKNTIFITKSSQLTAIFINSNANLVSSIIELSKEKIKLFKNGQLDFILLIERPSIFIEGTKKEKTIKDGVGGTGTNSEEISGCYQDFTENIKLILEKYKEAYGNEVGFNEFFRKYKHKCVFEAPSQKIKNIINIFTMYDISPKHYLRALSSFSSSNMLDVLDIYIELDCYHYIKDNPSKLIGKANSSIFEKIAISRVIGLPETEMFNQKQRSVEGSNNKYIDLKITNIDKIISEQNYKFNKFRLEDNFDKLELSMIKEMEEHIRKSSNSGIVLAQMALQNSNTKTILKYLEQFVESTNKLIYNIDGIRISKNKVLRLYNTLKSYNFEESLVMILYILTRNSYLNQEQFEKLKSKINNMLEKELTHEVKKI